MSLQMLTDAQTEDTSVHRDAQLVAACLAGGGRAWDELYERCHDRLVNGIRRIAGGHTDPNVVDEVAARVWYALTRSDFLLLRRYDATRKASLSSYLLGIARKEFSVYLRGEKRRHAREGKAAEIQKRERMVDFALDPAEIEEFLATLSEREREYFDNYLCTRKGQPIGQDISEVNSRQLSFRISRKLHTFLDS